MTARAALAAGALLGALAVVLGAFGAHALEGRLDAAALHWYGTASDWHARHALALLATGILLRQAPDCLALSAAAALLLAGTLVFCGSLYAMALSGLTGLGAITPIGGVLLIGGWLALSVGTLRRG